MQRIVYNRLAYSRLFFSFPWVAYYCGVKTSCFILQKTKINIKSLTITQKRSVNIYKKKKFLLLNYTKLYPMEVFAFTFT